MALNSAPTSFLDNSITTAGHVLPQQTELFERTKDGEIQMVERDEKIVDESGGKDATVLRSKFASWTQAALMRKFWRMYLLGILVAQAGM